MFKKKNLMLLLIAGIVSITILSAFVLKQPTGKLNLSGNNIGIKASPPVTTRVEASQDYIGPANIPPPPSGPVTSVPWENDENFQKALQQNGTPVLIAAYRTVLRDPLPGEEFNVHLAARLLAGTVVKPGEVFSQNQKVGPYTEAQGFQKGPTYIGSQLLTTIGGGVCKIASTTYNVAILANLQIVERHSHSMPVPYVPYGQDATVSYGSKDMRFMNNTSSPLVIWAQGVDNILYMGFYGKERPPKVEWQHEVLNTQKASTLYRKNPALSAGTEKIILEGMDGATIRSRLIIESPDGTKKTKELGISYYKPMPSLAEKGS